MEIAECSNPTLLGVLKDLFSEETYRPDGPRFYSGSSTSAGVRINVNGEWLCLTLDEQSFIRGEPGKVWRKAQIIAGSMGGIRGRMLPTISETALDGDWGHLIAALAKAASDLVSASIGPGHTAFGRQVIKALRASHLPSSILPREAQDDSPPTPQPKVIRPVTAADLPKKRARRSKK
jgi:hypothetical protein